MEQKRKNNRVLNIAALVLVFTLISSCLMGVTLAKYVTVVDTTQIARVAKWGVTIEKGIGLFQKTYETDSEEYIYEAEYNPDGFINSVESTTAVLAPGTDGKALLATMTGTPEVAVEILINSTGTDFTGWDSYNPILWKLTVDDGISEDVIFYNVQCNDLAEALNEATQAYPANTDLGTIKYWLSWEWNGFAQGTDDVEDTVLGNLETAPSVSLNYNFSVTQID